MRGLERETYILATITIERDIGAPDPEFVRRRLRFVLRSARMLIANCPNSLALATVFEAQGPNGTALLSRRNPLTIVVKPGTGDCLLGDSSCICEPLPDLSNYAAERLGCR
jgi:hypothetical protein